jgi:hypothetical protein
VSGSNRQVDIHPPDDFLISADESLYRRYDWDPRSSDRPSAVRQLMRRMEIVQPYPASSVVRKFPDGIEFVCFYPDWVSKLEVCE